jgi:uncharacterized protein YndB with AHSA1/START domain
MSGCSVQHDTIRIERRYTAPPARVFRAWTEPEARERWFVREEGWESEYAQDFRVGGRESGWFRRPGGDTYGNETLIQDIVPDARIVFAYTMARGEARISASLATVELVPDGAGTRLLFTEQIALLDGGDRAADREQGWRGLLDRLEAELKGELAAA